VSVDERAERLLRTAASLEEAIIRLEARLPGASQETVFRLRRLQADILTTLARLEGDSRSRP
jgi:hypothetical protein